MHRHASLAHLPGMTRFSLANAELGVDIKVKCEFVFLPLEATAPEQSGSYVFRGTMELVYYRRSLDLGFVAGPSHIQVGKLYAGLIDVTVSKLRRAVWHSQVHHLLTTAFLRISLLHTDILDGSTRST